MGWNKSNTSSDGGGAVSSSGIPQLAPDLSFPGSTAAGGRSGYKTILGINAVGALTPALSLTGKYVVDYLNFSSMTAETITVKLTVDGEVVWNNTFTSGIDLFLLGANSTVADAMSREPVMCNSSFLLEIQTTTDTNVTLNFSARPIL